MSSMAKNRGSFGFVRCTQQEAANLPLTIDAFGVDTGSRVVTGNWRLRIPVDAGP